MLNCNYNCLKLAITARLHPAEDHTSCENNYAKNIIVPRQQQADVFAYILRKQNLF